MSFGDLVWLFFIFSAIQPMLQQRMLEAYGIRVEPEMCLPVAVGSPVGGSVDGGGA